MDIMEALRKTAAMSTLCNAVPATVFEINIDTNRQVAIAIHPEPVFKTESQKILEYFLKYTAETSLVRSPRPEKPFRLIVIIDAKSQVTVHDMGTT